MMRSESGVKHRSKTAFPDFSAARILVAGDLMLDRYWSGPVRRISPEAPVPVVHVQHCQERPGGAANVAVNLAALGAQTHLAGILGEDEAGALLTSGLAAHGVTLHLQRCAELPTITKLRVLSQHQQLIRLDFESSLASLDRSVFVGLVEQALAQADLLLLSDYDKGALSDPQTLIASARAQHKPVLVDPKGDDFSRYRGATLMTPNRSELERIVGHCADDARLIERAQRLRDELALEALLVTLGERGMLLLRDQQPALHLPTQAREVFDVTGAGDTVIAVLAAALSVGVALPEACALANCAAGVAVGKLGAASVSAVELAHAYQDGERSRTLDQDALIEAVAAARARGETVVMTNGCFDLLHEGHVAYLEQARRLGDRLIVAVNDDDSVRRLKGAGRPINGVDQRMAVLAGLASVDWVCPFSEDTPEALICRVGPDILVKGGDYRPDEIAGAECVRARGGQVRVIEFLPDRSTSKIIDAVRAR